MSFLFKEERGERKNIHSASLLCQSCTGISKRVQLLKCYCSASCVTTHFWRASCGWEMEATTSDPRVSSSFKSTRVRCSPSTCCPSSTEDATPSPHGTEPWVHQKKDNRCNDFCYKDDKDLASQTHKTTIEMTVFSQGCIHSLWSPAPPPAADSPHTAVAGTFELPSLLLPPPPPPTQCVCTGERWHSVITQINHLECNKNQDAWH